MYGGIEQEKTVYGVAIHSFEQAIIFFRINGILFTRTFHMKLCDAGNRIRKLALTGTTTEDEAAGNNKTVICLYTEITETDIVGRIVPVSVADV